MTKHKKNRSIMSLYVLAVLLLAGCGKEEIPEEETGIVEDIENIENVENVEEDILPEEPLEEAEKQQGAEIGQGISPDTSENRVQQNVVEETGDAAGQDADQQKMSEGTEQDSVSARLQKFKSVLADVTTKQIYPDGTDCGFDGTSAASGNKFAIFDVDKDGEKELILCITSASMAGMREVIYDYDEGTDAVREEYSGFPGVAFYENGMIEEGLSHNQGMAPLGDFWPYMLYRYRADSDSYQCTFIVDAWEKAFREQDYDGNPYPEETDEEKSGIVYYLMEGGVYDMTSTVPVSKSRYEEWRKEQGLGGARIEIPFQALTEENIGNIK